MLCIIIYGYAYETNIAMCTLLHRNSLSRRVPYGLDHPVLVRESPEVWTLQFVRS